jgi:hypothetical protein
MKVKFIVILVVCVLVIMLAFIVAMATRRAHYSISGAAEQSDDELDSGEDPPFSNYEEALKKHFAQPPRHIIDLTARADGDTINFLRLYPKTTITAVLSKTGASPFVDAGEKPEGAVKTVKVDYADFLQDTDEKADFVYLDPPWDSAGLHAVDANGKRRDIASIVNMVFDRGIAPCVVLKAPFKFRTAEFSSHLHAPLVVHPIGRSRARHSNVSSWLLVADKRGFLGQY